MELKPYPQHNSAAGTENVVCYLTDLNGYVDTKGDNQQLSVVKVECGTLTKILFERIFFSLYYRLSNCKISLNSGFLDWRLFCRNFFCFSLISGLFSHIYSTPKKFLIDGPSYALTLWM